MTGYTVHTGASKKFVSGWDRIFIDDAATSKSAKKKIESSNKASKKIAAKAASKSNGKAGKSKTSSSKK